MNLKVPILSRKIFEFGSYTKPLLNFLLEQKIDLAFKHYLNSLNYIWNREYQNAKREIELGFKKCKNNASLYYLLLSNLFLISFFLKDENFKRLYSFIRKNYRKIPASIRKIFTQYMVNYSKLFPNNYFSKSRFWSRDVHFSPSTKLFLFIGKAREKIMEEKIEDAISFYNKGIKIAQSIPHPSGLITCLNDIAWYSLNLKPLKSLYFSEKGLYYLGYFYEEPKMHFYLLDTSFWIQKNLSYSRIFETKELIEIYNSDEFVKERYKNLLEEIKNYNVEFEKNIYENTENLREFLKRYIDNFSLASRKTKIARSKIFNIMKGISKSIRGTTLRKLILGMNIEFEQNLPFPIYNELIKINIDKFFENSIKYFKKLDKIQGKKILISTFISLFNREKYFKMVSRKDVINKIFDLYEKDLNELIDYIKESFELKRFFAYFLSPPPFIKGRKELILKILNSIDEEKLNKFIYFYLSLKGDEQELFDIFLRNSMRFLKLSIKLNVEFENYITLKEFTSLFNINFDSAILSYYYFKGWERVKIKRIINKLLPLLKKDILNVN